MVEAEFKQAVDPVWLRKVARWVLMAENAGSSVNIGLVITGQEKIRELNRQYLDEDAPTDVLSFPMSEPGAGATFINPPDHKLHLGEVIISYPQALKQAEEHRHPVRKEIAILLIHGILHLMGYDHDVPERQQAMNERESSMLQIIEESCL